nr:hypothetical protein [Saccharothrix sp. ALI-22-I]
MAADHPRRRRRDLLLHYTKEVSRFRRLVEPDPPANLLWVFSLGGKEDHLIDFDRDRVADVFPAEDRIVGAGWHSQFLDDRLAVLGPAPVGMAANSTADRNKLGGRRLSELQRQADEQLARFRRDRADRRRHG